jgi:two-component system sensor histidine kinase ChiS
MNKGISRKKSVGVVIVMAAILMMFSTIYYVTLPNGRSVEAIDGRLNLASWDFKEDGIVFLNGTWDFYPGRLLMPGEVAQEVPQPMKVPRTWNKYPLYGSVRGSATYHLSVVLPKDAGPLALKVQNIWMAHRLYINGVLAKEMGSPAYAYKDHESRNTPYLINIEPGEHLDMVIQVSNHTYYSGGIIHPIRLGNAESMLANYQLALGLDMAGFFIFLLFGIFHLQLYQMRNRETAYLYSGLFLLLTALAISMTGEKLFMRVIDLPFALTYKLQDLIVALSIVMWTLFIRAMEPRVIKTKFLKYLLSPPALYMVLVAVLPMSSYIYLKGPITIYANMLLFFFIFRFMYILVTRIYINLPLDEFIYVTATLAFETSAFFDALLYHLGYVLTNILEQMSMLGFILFLNLLLARRFTDKMNEVQALSEGLIRSNQIKEEFLRRTTYAIKTPLKGIYNISAHLLRERDLPFNGMQRENIALIQDTSNKLSLFVNDLIDAIKLRHEDMQLQVKTVDLYVITQVVFELLSFDIRGKDLRFINLIKPVTLVSADENRLRQILYNVVSNAVKYTERGTIKANAFHGEDSVVLRIEDTGIGIQRDKWELIFEDSYVQEEEEGWPDEGMGMGLYLSRRLARKMNGEVWVSDSFPGKGTQISVKLPRGEGEHYRLAAEAAAGYDIDSREAGLEKRNRASKKLLLVDDETVNIRILSLILEDEFQIYGAYSGEEALALLQKNSFDLVVADTMMPGMSGIELTQRIRSQYSVLDLPIVIMRSVDGDRSIEVAYQAGANDFIAKPFAAEEVRVRIRNLLQLADAMETALQNELAFLQAQIKPHFVYNALSNIIALCYEDGEGAAGMLTQLSKFLRYVFQRDQGSQCLPLRQELELITAYVEIEKLRFGDRLEFKSYVDREVLEGELLLPALLVQPLVENAIRHGLFNKIGVGTVTLTVTEGRGFVGIVVEDDGIGMGDDQLFRIMNREEHKGVGIKNIQRRVEAIPRASFSIHSELEKGTRCTIFLPKEAMQP